MKSYGLNTILIEVKDRKKMERLIHLLEERGIRVLSKKEESYPQLVISDNLNLIQEAEKTGVSTIALLSNLDECENKKADLFVLDFESLDVETIFQTYCHHFGLAYEIGENEKLSVRELSEEDVDNYIEISREEHIRKFLPDGLLSKEEMRERLLSYMKKVYPFYGFGIYGLFLKPENKLIGAVSLDLKESTGKSEYEVGFFISHYYLGLGYGIMGLEFLIDFSFSFFQIERLISITASSNLHAIKLLEKVGFKLQNKEETYVFSLEKGLYEKMKESRTGE